MISLGSLPATVMNDSIVEDPGGKAGMPPSRACYRVQPVSQGWVLSKRESGVSALRWDYYFLFTTIYYLSTYGAVCCTQVWQSILLERQVVVRATTYRQLTHVACALRQLIQPLSWHYVFIPIVPTHNLELL